MQQRLTLTEVINLAHDMQINNIINDEELESIKKRDSSHDKVRIIVLLLRTKPYSAFLEFVNVLRSVREDINIEI